jgi:hypothetical protein
MPKTKRLTRREAMLGCVALGVLARIIPAAGADTTLQQSLKSLERLIGVWRGEGDGQPGASKVERSYEPALGGQFLMVRNRSSYAPQQRNPIGEIHDDMGFYSFDKARECIVLRQFHAEGFVNQYVARRATPESETILFESETIENIPTGWRARETYRFLDTDTFEEVFELAEPGMDFTLYSRSRLRRA